MKPGLIRAAAGLFFVFPFLVLIFYFGRWSLGETSEWARALRNSFLQAGLSAVLSVALGFAGALGLNHWRRHAWTLKALFLLPNFIPPLFVMIAVFQILRPFPFGITGIVLVNTLINLGLCAVVIQSIMESKIAGWAELALIEGSGRLRFWTVCLKYLLKDLTYVGFFVFCICFSSLSIPLLAGRFNSTTLEALIYEKIRIGDNWNEVLGLAVLQSLVIFALGWWLRLPESPVTVQRRNLKLLRWRPGVLPALVSSLAILAELGITAPVGLRQIRAVGWAFFPLGSALAQSLWISLGVGALVLIFCGGICYSLPHRNFEKFLSAYVAPSAALTAFAFYILGWENSRAVTALALLCVFFPAVFRLYVAGTFRGLLKQIETARVLGAGPGLIFWSVTWPSTSTAMGLAAGLASFWAVGDFAVTGLLLGSGPPLAVLGKKLLESYRVEAAGFFVMLLLFLGLLSLILFWSLGYVLGERPLSRLRRLQN
jgi:thiamine transport system permease protein